MKHFNLIASTISALVITASGSFGATISGFGDPLTNSDLIAGNQQTFDSVRSGDYHSITLDDVKYSGIGGKLTIGASYNGQYNTTGRKSVYNGFDLRPDQFRFDFLTQVNAFGFNFGASNNNWSLKAFSATGSLLETLIIAPTLGSNAGNYYGISSLTPIAYALLTDANNRYCGDFVFFDRFTTKMNSNDVPIPAALPMLLSAVGGLAVMRRRKRRQYRPLKNCQSASDQRA